MAEPAPDDLADRPPMVIAPVVLDGTLVRLEPLSLEHLDDLVAAGRDADLWTWTLTRNDDPVAMRRYVEIALVNRDAGTELPFATVDRATGRAIGSTRYLSIVPAHRRLEIGYTWLGSAWQRRGYNLDAKLVMLRHAFEVLGCLRVEFKTDARNLRSRTALRGIGATEEGVFRRHMITPAGRIRDSAYYSVVDSDWPAARDDLAARVRRHAEGSSGPPVDSNR